MNHVTQEAGIAVDELKRGGYTSKELKRGGFTADELLVGGFLPKELREGGYVHGRGVHTHTHSSAQSIRVPPSSRVVVEASLRVVAAAGTQPRR